VRIDRLDQPDPRLADQPGSRQDLRQRLDGLARGHPSSPYDHDGSSRPPAPDLRRFELPDQASQEPEPPERPEHAERPEHPDRSDLDAPRPLTDAEHADHVRDVTRRLDQAHAAGLATDRQHTIDPAREVWSGERDALHDDIIDAFSTRSAEVPCERKAILAGGLGGAGKSTILGEHAGIDQSRYLTINPDEIKEELARRGMVPHVEGLSPLEASDLVHEESSHIAKRLARHARVEGKNVIWDITMSSQASAERRITELRSSGYTQVDGIFVDIPVETSVARADARHREGHDSYRSGEGLGGRFVPAEVIRAQTDPEWGSSNRKTFEVIKSQLDRWSVYDNSVEGGPPKLADDSRNAERTHDQRSH
jgi:predicted kinase